MAVSRARATPCAEARSTAIAKAAYLRAARRGFDPGHELADWLAAQADFERDHDGDHFCGD